VADAITVGPKLGNTYVLPVDGVAHDSLKLIEVTKEKSAVLQFSESISGHVRIGEEFMSLATARTSKHANRTPDGLYRITLSNNDRADLVIGHVSFALDWLDKEVTVVPRAQTLTRKQLSLLLAFLFLFIGVIYFISKFVPVEEPEKPPERLVTILPRNQPAKAAMGERKSEDGGAQKGESGKAEVAAPEKVSATENLRRANLGSVLSGLTALGAKAPATTAQTAVKGAAPQKGTGGFSTEGLKTGGGGKTVGIGRAVGRGEGGFEGTGRLGLSGDAAVEGGTGYGSGPSVTRGGLDRGVIESVVRKRQDRIRLCYERQLNFNPKLAGKLTVHFVIGNTGNVLVAEPLEDTIKNGAVRSCVLSEVKSWNFPPPEGGTLVTVDYPFIFESSAR